MDEPDWQRPAEDGVLDLRQPPRLAIPLVGASPHSGADYPDDFLAAARLDPLTLRRSEDSFVDALFAAAPDIGAPLLSARFPRAYLDVNREAWELDPAMFSDTLPSFVNARSPRVRMGLGTIARVVASGEEIYARKLRVAEAARAFLAQRNLAVVLNAPYAGGFTTGHYGNPRRGRHALQIEINRALYMDERSYQRKPGFDRLQTEMTALVAQLGEIMLEYLAESPRAAAE